MKVSEHYRLATKRANHPLLYLVSKKLYVKKTLMLAIM